MGKACSNSPGANVRLWCMSCGTGDHHTNAKWGPLQSPCASTQGGPDAFPNRHWCGAPGHHYQDCLCFFLGNYRTMKRRLKYNGFC